MEIEVSGIPIEIRKKKVKYLRITVSPPDGRVRVSAPLFVSDNEIIYFINEKIGWIEKQRKKYENYIPPEPPQINTGDTVYLWGKPYTLELQDGENEGIVIVGDTAVLTSKTDSTPEQRQKLLKEWYRGLLIAEIEKILPELECLTGLKCNCFATKQMKTRWGSCNTNTKKLWFSLQLAQKPVYCLDYVILHELAHTKVPNHGKEFRAILDLYMPQWKDIKKILNKR